MIWPRSSTSSRMSSLTSSVLYHSTLLILPLTARVRCSYSKWCMRLWVMTRQWRNMMDHWEIMCETGRIQIMYDDETEEKHDGSLGEYVRDRLKKDLTNHSQLSHLLSTPLFDQVIEFFGKWENTIDGSDSWFETSAKGSLQFVKLEGCSTTTWKTGGYSNAFKLMMKQMPGQTPIDLSKQIILNKEVDKINWEDPHNVIVTCKDGSDYFTEKVLSTVSLGVLKSKSELFAPPLPSWKTNAIQGLFIGTVDKIFIKFPHKWWPDNNLGFNLFWTKEDEKTLFSDIGGVNDKPWVMDVVGFYLTTQDPLTYLGWITGPSARYMESLSDEQVSIDTMKLLRHFLGNNYTIPDPVRVLKSSWGTNPHFRGSYSCRSLTTEKLNASAAELGAPVENSQGKPVLLFAGEATHPRFFSTVHGAIESGWREADRVLKSDQQPHGTR
uniref:Spermine oxidase n=1 Tax=Cacopsylla melanoneura TaxID=428564 RepID=A0A8D8WVN8_9HEMI